MAFLDKRPFESVKYNPEQPLPEDHLALLADLIRYCAEVMLRLFPFDQDDYPEDAQINHEHISAFENAVWQLERQKLAVPCKGPVGMYFRLARPLEQFPDAIRERFDAGELKFDDFNRALEAPFHLDNQTDIRASRATITRIIEGLAKLGIVDGPAGSSQWTEKALLYIWFTAYGNAVEAFYYSGDNEFEKFLQATDY